MNQKSELQRVMESKGFKLKSTTAGADTSTKVSEDGAKKFHAPDEFIHVHRKITSHGSSDTNK